VELFSIDKLSCLPYSEQDLIVTRGGGGQTIVFTNTKEEADNLVGVSCFLSRLLIGEDLMFLLLSFVGVL
jgi:hypothetical protein